MTFFVVMLLVMGGAAWLGKNVLPLVASRYGFRAVLVLMLMVSGVIFLLFVVAANAGWIVSTP